uniref:Uncharacterized protein n=1 Tax=Setaria digitata TaxID=48799 RepID=A0A915PZ75_9BILA
MPNNSNNNDCTKTITLAVLNVVAVVVVAVTTAGVLAVFVIVVAKVVVTVIFERNIDDIEGRIVGTYTDRPVHADRQTDTHQRKEKRRNGGEGEKRKGLQIFPCRPAVSSRVDETVVPKTAVMMKEDRRRANNRTDQPKPTDVDRVGRVGVGSSRNCALHAMRAEGRVRAGT